MSRPSLVIVAVALGVVVATSTNAFAGKRQVYYYPAPMAVYPATPTGVPAAPTAASLAASPFWSFLLKTAFVVVNDELGNRSLGQNLNVSQLLQLLKGGLDQLGTGSALQTPKNLPTDDPVISGINTRADKILEILKIEYKAPNGQPGSGGTGGLGKAVDPPPPAAPTGSN
ncbi:MAG: hypothetical protein JSS02_30825 [Planctomycetes bacterium]|nr:hypothetical protein [Planctomycetota bacterium]